MIFKKFFVSVIIGLSLSPLVSALNVGEKCNSSTVETCSCPETGATPLCVKYGTPASDYTCACMLKAVPTTLQPNAPSTHEHSGGSNPMHTQ